MKIETIKSGCAYRSRNPQEMYLCLSNTPYSNRGTFPCVKMVRYVPFGCTYEPTVKYIGSQKWFIMATVNHIAISKIDFAEARDDGSCETIFNPSSKTGEEFRRALIFLYRARGKQKEMILFHRGAQAPLFFF